MLYIYFHRFIIGNQSYNLKYLIFLNKIEIEKDEMTEFQIKK